jgi:hypothetical protein
MTTQDNITNQDYPKVTDRVHVQLIDGAIAWVPANAHKISMNEFLILPDSEFDENDFINLCEFVPGDIVSTEQKTFNDGTIGFACKELIKSSTRANKKFFDFLFKTASGEFEISTQNFETYKTEIEKIKKLNASGKDFYDNTLLTIQKLEQAKV